MISSLTALLVVVAAVIGSTELLTIQQELSALAERLDFTEKLLTSSDDAGESADSA